MGIIAGDGLRSTMIAKCEDCEYTVSIADLMVTLSKLDKFRLLIWIGSELPFVYTQDDDFKFLQESLKIVTDSAIEYIFYDIITGLRVEYYDNNERMAKGYS